MKILFCVFVFVFNFNLLAHNLHEEQFIPSDSNYIAYLRIKGLLGEEYNSYITDRKCGFSLVNSVKLNADKFSSDKRQIIQSVMQRPTKQTFIISPSGRFKIHYDTIGVHAVQYSVIEIAKAIDSVYNFEVLTMGFPPAPSDNNAGGDNRYDIYIHNISPLYGYTEFENPLGGDRYTSFIVIDNSFHESDYYTKGLDAAKVTLAHEYHHAIQIGNYRYADNDVWFYELTSTSMEEFVFDSINDYYAYIPTFFNRPDKIFTGFDGYSQAVWNIYLHKIFDYDFSIFVRQWDLIKNFRALECIRKSIEERGKSFKSIFSQFYLYNYFTGYRSIPDKYYEEGSNYPLVKINYSFQFIQPGRTISGKSQACAANYYVVIDSILKLPFQPDSIIIILVNSNVDSALNWSNLSRSFDYTLRVTGSQSDQSFKKISTNLFSKLEVSDPANWSDIYVLNDTIAVIAFKESGNYAFPMPANLNKHNFINIPIPKDWNSEVDLYIYSVGMKLIYNSKKSPLVYDDKVVVQWNGKNNSNEKTSSGIYFYFLENGGKKSIGKIVIINE
ncbi:MAG: MXAN_6640 family putative metalloprotease [Ignavibacteria bacterium]